VTIDLDTARAPDGAQIAYRLSGAHPSRRVALIHSLAMDHSFWNPVTDILSNDAAVLTIDCRGHGASDTPPGPYTVEQFAGDLAAVMDQVGWSSAVVAGCSMGGCVSLAFTAAYPDRVIGLGLFDTTAWYGPEAPQQWGERAERALAEGLEGLTEFQVTRWFGDRFRAERPDIVRQTVAVFLANDVTGYAESCRMLGACDLRASLPNIRVPTRIAVGEEDYATPIAMAEALHQGIEGSTLTIIEGARHLTPLETPERIADEIEKLFPPLGR
jgi:3-oxoadipate enol-lactonase